MKSALSIVIALVTIALGPGGAHADDANNYDQQLAAAIGHIKTGESGRAIEILLPQYSAADWEVAFWLGSAHLLAGNLDLARAYLDDSLTTRSDVIDVWIQRAIVEQEADRPEVTIELLYVAANLDPDHPAVHLNMAYALERLGRTNDAIGAYRTYLRVAAPHPAYARQTPMIIARMLELAGNGSAAQPMSEIEVSAAATLR